MKSLFFALFGMLKRLILQVSMSGTKKDKFGQQWHNARYGAFLALKAAVNRNPSSAKFRASLKAAEAHLRRVYAEIDREDGYEAQYYSIFFYTEMNRLQRAALDEGQIEIADRARAVLNAQILEFRRDCPLLAQTLTVSQI